MLMMMLEGNIWKKKKKMFASYLVQTNMQLLQKVIIYELIIHMLKTFLFMYIQKYIDTFNNI